MNRENMKEFPATGFLRVKQVLQFFPVSRSAWWAGVAEGRYPKPVKLGPRTTAWRVQDILTDQIPEIYAGGACVRKRNVHAAGTGEFRIHIKAMAYVRNDYEGRAALSGGQGAYIALCLTLSADHCIFPRSSPAINRSGTSLVEQWQGKGQGGLYFLALFSLQYEATLLVQVKTLQL